MHSQEEGTRMYNLLIVDDEIHIVKGLVADLDKEKLEIADIYQAYNIRQARDVLMKHKVDIMLCDIEMPQGTGLELLEWTNTHAPHVQTIILTSHADFRYARQAMKLGGIDYLLKPVPEEELEQAIGKARARLRQSSKVHELERLWSSNRPSLIELFWTELLQQKIPSTPSAIRKELEERDMAFSENIRYLPILISIRRWHKNLSVRDEKIMEYALKKTALELIAGEDQGATIITLERGALLYIMPLESQEDQEDAVERIFAACQSYVDNCHRYFYCDLSCYVGSMVEIHDMLHMMARLRAFERNNVVHDNTVFHLTGTASRPETRVVEMPMMNAWAVMLKNGMKQQVLAEIRAYLEERVARGEADAELLQQFQQNFLQTVYFILMATGRTAHECIGDSISMKLSRDACNSIADMIAWVEHTVSKVVAPDYKHQQPHEIVEHVKRFIAAHLDQSDLSREEIAQHAYLNPDYLTRIFKRETGQSLMEYLLEERIKLAKELLLNSGKTVGEIASAVGFSHFSHFSRMFRRVTGVNPNEYRQMHRGQEAEVR